MTAATDTTLLLTPEHVGVIQLTVNSHMLRFGPELADALDRYAGKPDLLAVDRIARRLQFCIAVLADVECGFVRGDEEGLRELLIECETEQEESARKGGRAGQARRRRSIRRSHGSAKSSRWPSSTG